MGNRSQGELAKVTNRAGVLKHQGIAANTTGGSGFSQMSVAGSNFIDSGTTSGWYSAFGGNGYSTAGASENPFARLNAYNADQAALYPDLVRTGLQATRFKMLPSEGSYFQCVDISQVSDLGEAEFCKWLTTEIGVAAIPLSAFYGNGFDQRVVRFCFAKKDETLKAALERLAKL
jgi:bifunctional pyridoxal-dependent enzyme with beta-cystathionase and maltose regulon repressor activities